MFLKPLARDEMLAKDEISAIFSDMELIVLLNSQLWKDLEERMNEWPMQHVGDVFSRAAPVLLIYFRYIHNYDHAMEVLTKCLTEKPEFKRYIEVTPILLPVIHGNRMPPIIPRSNMTWKLI
jgi:hypothetical protein